MDVLELSTGWAFLGLRECFLLFFWEILFQVVMGTLGTSLFFDTSSDWITPRICSLSSSEEVLLLELISTVGSVNTISWFLRWGISTVGLLSAPFSFVSTVTVIWATLWFRDALRKSILERGCTIWIPPIGIVRVRLGIITWGWECRGRWLNTRWPSLGCMFLERRPCGRGQDCVVLVLLWGLCVFSLRGARKTFLVKSPSGLLDIVERPLIQSSLFQAKDVISKQCG